jgi:DNA-binding NtrC family response regulator
MLGRVLARDGYQVEYFERPESGLARLRESPFDIVLTDLRMPGLDGIEVLRRVKAIRPSCEVVLMTAHASVQTVREALLRGAVDYITKPFSATEELRPLLRSILEASAGDEGEPEPSRVDPAPARHGVLAEIVGESRAIREVLAKVERFAHAEAPVLLEGESGTGKEATAKALHALSARAGEPFVAVNCAALPESLLESELFGYARGAFTGAATDRSGLFQAAHGGTLFLDEIGELPLALQPKLLRVLEGGEFHRLGDSRRTVRVDVRVIAATNRDLGTAVKEGRFRGDLFFRLHVLPIALPPLRARRGDIPLLVGHFLALHAGERALAFSREALDALVGYDWPGNVRELANAVEHAVVLGDGPELGLGDLPVAIQDRWQPPSFAEDAASRGTGTLGEVEARCILQALAKTGMNRTRAARLLGVTRRTLGYRIRKYGLQAELDGVSRSPVVGCAAPSASAR